MNNFIQKIKFPIQKSNILPCTQQICYCIEYLDFGKKNDVIHYRNCMITNANNNNYNKKVKNHQDWIEKINNFYDFNH